MFLTATWKPKELVEDKCDQRCIISDSTRMSGLSSEHFLLLSPTFWGCGVGKVNCQRSCSLRIRADKISILVHPLVNPKQFECKTCLQLYVSTSYINNCIFFCTKQVHDVFILNLEILFQPNFYVSSFKIFVHPTVPVEARRLDESKLSRAPRFRAPRFRAATPVVVPKEHASTGRNR